jgi:hypothetical protein
MIVTALVLCTLILSNFCSKRVSHTDWLAEHLSNGGTLQSAARENPQAILRHGRNAQLLAQLLQPFRSVDSVVTTVFLQSPTGFAKTVGAMSFLEKSISDSPFFVWSPKSSGNWWDGYAGEEWVLIDELDSGAIPLCELLRTLQSCRYSVPVHGGQVSLLATKFIITSNLSPEDIYPKASSAHLAALHRRLSFRPSSSFIAALGNVPHGDRVRHVVSYLSRSFSVPLLPSHPSFLELDRMDQDGLRFEPQPLTPDVQPAQRMQSPPSDYEGTGFFPDSPPARVVVEDTPSPLPFFSPLLLQLSPDVPRPLPLSKRRTLFRHPEDDDDFD